MPYEVDFLPFAADQRSGDAIALRFGNLSGRRTEQTVVVIDGGFTETGERLVQHINRFYATNRVDLVVSTHPDADHASGLEVVVEKMEVGELWLHRPWNHTQDIAKMFQDGRVTDLSVEEKIRKALQDVRDIERIALRKKIPIVEPFTGLSDATKSLIVMGPTLEYYDSLLPDFRCTPQAKTSNLMKMLKGISEGAIEAVKTVFESWDYETLSDTGDPTSAENNSSVILLLSVDGRNLLFSADAGIPALSQAAEILEAINVIPNNLKFIQVPHHGSRRNVGPTILNRLLGPKRTADVDVVSAFVSAKVDGLPKHPARKVTNAFRRRGAPVRGSNGQTMTHWHNAPARAGWRPLTPIPMHSEVDE